MSTLILTDEQEHLRETAREFIAEKAPVAALRTLRDSKDEVGFSRELWSQMAELGWAGIAIPEEYGGIELGYAELGVILEECGRNLVASPLVSTVLFGAEAVMLGGTDAQKQRILPGVCQGETILALAHQETPRFEPYSTTLLAKEHGDGWKLSGSKHFVLDGHVADEIIVVARTAGEPGDRDGLSLFLVGGRAEGRAIQRTIMVDSRGASALDFEDVSVSGECLLGELHRGADVLDVVFDRGAAGLAAECLGTLTEAFDRTIAYLKTRRQFDTVIGTFQSLKHRAAEMFCEVELSRSIVLEALRAIDEERGEVPSLVSAAKARVSDTAGLVTREAIQMHGGIGMTDEEEIGFFLKRARVVEIALGDAAYHRDRFARLQGF
jgi:alkylation response protein AidB-like acyl-CoA dehydrogenase